MEVNPFVEPRNFCLSYLSSCALHTWNDSVLVSHEDAGEEKGFTKYSSNLGVKL